MTALPSTTLATWRGAGFFTQLASLAQFRDDAGDALSHNAHVVQVGLHTVIGAAAHRDLELVGQLDSGVALEEAFVDRKGQGVGIDQAVLAGGTLTGDHWADLGAGAAGLQTSLLPEKSPKGLDIFKGNALDLHGQAGGHGYLAAAEALGCLRDDMALLRSDLSVPGDDTAVESILGALVPEKSQGLDPGDLTLRDRGRFGIGFVHIVTSLNGCVTKAPQCGQPSISDAFFSVSTIAETENFVNQNMLELTGWDCSFEPPAIVEENTWVCGNVPKQ